MALFACFPEDWGDWKDTESDPNFISNIDFSPNGRLIASTTAYALFYVWNWRDGSLRIFRELENNSCNIRFSPDGRYIVLGMKGDVLIWDVRTDQLVEKLTGHSHMVCGIAFTPDDMRLVTSSHDGTVKFWNRNFAGRNGSGSQSGYNKINDTRKELFTFGHPDDGVDRVRLFCFFSEYIHLSFVSSKSGSCVTFVRFSSNGRWVVSCSPNGVYLWDAQNAELEEHFKLIVFEDDWLHDRFDFCPTSGCFAFGFDNDRQVLLWKFKDVSD